jgi:hypothetical protein
MTTESYWRLTDDMDLRDHLPEVWTSPEAHQRFLENELGPASAAAGVPGPTKVSVLPLIRHF